VGPDVGPVAHIGHVIQLNYFLASRLQTADRHRRQARDPHPPRPDDGRGNRRAPPDARHRRRRPTAI